MTLHPLNKEAYYDDLSFTTSHGAAATLLHNTCVIQNLSLREKMSSFYNNLYVRKTTPL